MNSSEFWNNRFQGWMKEFLRYSRYIFNDHFALVLLIAIGGGGYYYQGWVKELTPDFPTALVFGLVIGFFLVKGFVSTFLQEPDKVFMLPLETQLKPYLTRSFLFSYVWQSFILLLVVLVLAPIYTRTIPEINFTLFVGLLFVLKAINIWIRWNVDFEVEKSYVVWDAMLRFFLNGVIIFLFLKNHLVLALVAALILCLYGGYLHWRATKKGLPWERLIENEEKRLGSFYRLANIFTDVPHLRNQIKRRKMLDVFMSAIPFQKEKSYTYLFLRTFFRSGDYFGLLVRLTIIGGFLIWAFGGTYIGFFLAIFFIYITGIQLMSIWNHHDGVIWTLLYPLDEKIKKKSFLKLLLDLLWTQNLVFTLLYITSGEWVKGLILFGILILFIYWFVYLYVQSRITKGRSKK